MCLEKAAAISRGLKYAPRGRGVGGLQFRCQGFSLTGHVRERKVEVYAVSRREITLDFEVVRQCYVFALLRREAASGCAWTTDGGELTRRIGHCGSERRGVSLLRLFSRFGSN